MIYSPQQRMHVCVMMTKKLFQTHHAVRRGLSFFDKSKRNWETAWSEENTPWETGSSTPGLQEAISLLTNTEESSINKVPSIDCTSASVLIPGSGSGHDIVYLRKSGFRYITAVDISETATIRAKNNYMTQIKDDHMHEEAVKFLTADIFKYRPSEKYDIIFDYLFFSAIDIPQREIWALSMQHLIKPTSGVLATLIFPYFNPNIDRIDDCSIGPPYRTRLEDYANVLKPLGFHNLAFKPVSVSSCQTTRSYIHC